MNNFDKDIKELTILFTKMDEGFFSNISTFFKKVFNILFKNINIDDKIKKILEEKYNKLKKKIDDEIKENIKNFKSKYPKFSEEQKEKFIKELDELINNIISDYKKNIKKYLKDYLNNIKTNKDNKNIKIYHIADYLDYWDSLVIKLKYTIADDLNKYKIYNNNTYNKVKHEINNETINQVKKRKKYKKIQDLVKKGNQKAYNFFNKMFSESNNSDLFISLNEYKLLKKI